MTADRGTHTADGGALIDGHQAGTERAEPEAIFERHWTKEGRERGEGLMDREDDSRGGFDGRHEESVVWTVSGSEE